MKYLQLLLLLTIFALGASAQNVGIGTPTPSDQLHTTGTVRFEKYKAPNTRMMQIDSSGRLVVTSAGAVALNNTAQAIPDNGCTGGNGITSPIIISGQAIAVPSSKIAVRVNITHTYDGDLKIFLIPPGGGSVLALANNNGSNGANFTNTIFTDQALSSVTTGTAPFTGQYRPSGNSTGCQLTGTVLANFGGIGGGNVVPNGTWTLRIFDAYLNDIGTLNNWSISFSGPESITTADENNYIPKFSAGNLVASSIYQPAGSTNIGIGTTTPTAKLEINGTLKITDGTQGAGKVLTSDATGLVSWSTPAGGGGGGLPAAVSGNTLRHDGTAWIANSFLYNNGTSIGIGNTNPLAPLSFASATGNKISLWGNASGAHYGIGVAGGGLQLYSDGSSSDILFGYGSSSSFTEKMRVKGNGNVGIGTNNPTASLDVVRGTGPNGTARFYGTTYASHFNYSTGEETYIRGGMAASEVFINDQGTGNVRIADAGGNVGIGINALITNPNPTLKLDVNGRMRIRSTAESAGLWFNKTTNIDNEGTFIGQLTDQRFGIYSANAWQFAVDNTDGTVFCGSSNLLAEDLTKGVGYKLRVFGKIIAEEVRVQLKTSWPDYVFSKNYKLRSLPETEKYIAENNHLPNMPAAAEVEKSGILLGDMQTKMMEKIEELTLYIIDLNKKINEQDGKIKKLEGK